MKNYNDYNNDYGCDLPKITEEFANKMKAEKESTPKLSHSREISKAVREADGKERRQAITANSLSLSARL